MILTWLGSRSSTTRPSPPPQLEDARDLLPHDGPRRRVPGCRADRVHEQLDADAGEEEAGVAESLGGLEVDGS